MDIECKNKKTQYDLNLRFLFPNLQNRKYSQPVDKNE